MPSGVSVGVGKVPQENPWLVLLVCGSARERARACLMLIVERES